MVFGLAALALTLVAVWVSVLEGEPKAARRMALLGVSAGGLPLLVSLLPGEIGNLASVVLLSFLPVSALVLLLPLGREGGVDLGSPQPGVDERGIMFSRALLEPGSTRFDEYYQMRPEHREPDDVFRREPGLLSTEASLHHPLGFPAADAAFWTIEMLRPFVEGEAEGRSDADASGEGAMLGVLGGGPAEAVMEGGDGAELDPGGVTRFLREWALKLGAHSVGFTELKDYHLYSHVGRGPGFGEPVELEHSHALALTVEMDKEMVDRAPHSPTAMESAHQYVRSGVMAIQLADLLRRLGYGARAHVDGCYRVICPLVAWDAGLGELGRMGLLMTPKLGPRCRIAVVTTDFPLVPDPSRRELSVIDFCLRCRKCADACPSRALPFGPPEEVDGVLRWKIDAEACFTLWCRLGTDCARCMSVCPYSHPDNWMHGFVRWGIRNNALFRRISVWGDDLVYGRRPSPKELQRWFELPDPDGAAGTLREVRIE